MQLIDANVSARIQGILAKLKEARNRGLSCFGSNKHHFQLNPPIDEAEIEAFEARHCVELPEDYSAFLRLAGNGGAGPYYGIYPLQNWDDFSGGVAEGADVDFLLRPCPLTRNLVREEGWEKQFGESSPYCGTISIGTQGCSYIMQLIVTGPCRGAVVYGDMDGGPPKVMREPDFLSWYERWLDELLAGYKTDWFGFALGGTEADFLSILGDEGENDDLKAEAMQAIYRLPAISNSAEAAILRGLDHRNQKLQAATCTAAAEFAVAPAQDGIALLLKKDDAQVRRSAVQALIKLNPERWADAVIERLFDSDREVASAAYFCLNRAGRITQEIRLSLLADESVTIASLAADGMTWMPAHGAMLEKMLLHADSQVRRAAANGLRAIQARASIPALLQQLSLETDESLIDQILKSLGDMNDPAPVPTLLEWAKSEDDFHRLAAVESLAKLGDVRAVAVIQPMLSDTRKPVRRGSRGMMTNIHPINELVRRALQTSPGEQLRQLARISVAPAPVGTQDRNKKRMPWRWWR
jgi:HEAT repeat protein